MRDETTENNKHTPYGIAASIAGLALAGMFFFSAPASTPQETQTTATEEANRDNGNVTVKSFQYLYDSSTKLCFVYYYEGRNNNLEFATGGPSLTWVPCSPAVMAKVVNKPAEGLPVSQGPPQ